MIVLNPFLDSLCNFGIKNIGLTPGIPNGCFQHPQDVVNIFHMYVISSFSLCFILEWSTLRVELNFTTFAMFLANLADLSCLIMAYVVMASYFWKNLRNG